MFWGCNVEFSLEEHEDELLRKVWNKKSVHLEWGRERKGGGFQLREELQAVKCYRACSSSVTAFASNVLSVCLTGCSGESTDWWEFTEVRQGLGQAQQGLDLDLAASLELLLPSAPLCPTTVVPAERAFCLNAELRLHGPAKPSGSLSLFADYK